MLDNIKTIVMFLLWARFIQLLVCNRENQKHIRGLIGLLTICMMLAPFHKMSIGKIGELIEESALEQEMDNNKITGEFWKNCEEMIDEEMNGENWKQHYENTVNTMQKEDGNNTNNSETYSETTDSNIKVRVLLK